MAPVRSQLLPGEPEKVFVSYCSKGREKIHPLVMAGEKDPPSFSYLSIKKVTFYDTLCRQPQS